MSRATTTEPASTQPVTTPPGRERLVEVRLQAGAVHWQGARPVTHLTTDRTKTGVSGAHVIVADELSLHPAGCMIRVDGATFIVPHARVETYRLA